MTRVLVTRHPDHSGRPNHSQPDPSSSADQQVSGEDNHAANFDLDPAASPAPGKPEESGGLQGQLRAAMRALPPTLGGAPTQPLEVGRTTRVVHPAQRAALAVRDGGCVFPGCERPLAWCDAHHLWHWVDGGPTDLANLALLCRAHHHQVHEEGWQLTRGPDGRFTATPTRRRHRGAA